MIIVKISYGLGNQMFQYALCRCLAHKHNTELKLDLAYYETDNRSLVSVYQLGAFNIQENIATDEDIKSCSDFSVRKFSTLQGDFSPEVFNCGDNAYISGLLMCEKYFSEIENIIRQEFTLKNPLEKKSAAWKEKILSAKSSGIFVRGRRESFYKSGKRQKSVSIKPYSEYSIEISQ